MDLYYDRPGQENAVWLRLSSIMGGEIKPNDDILGGESKINFPSGKNLCASSTDQLDSVSNYLTHNGNQFKIDDFGACNELYNSIFKVSLPEIVSSFRNLSSGGSDASAYSNQLTAIFDNIDNFEWIDGKGPQDILEVIASLINCKLMEMCTLANTPPNNPVAFETFYINFMELLLVMGSSKVKNDKNEPCSEVLKDDLNRKLCGSGKGWILRHFAKH